MQQSLEDTLKIAVVVTTGNSKKGAHVFFFFFCGLGFVNVVQKVTDSGLIRLHKVSKAEKAS